MDILFVLIFAISCSVSVITARAYYDGLSNNSRYACGIRKRFGGAQMIPNNTLAEPGQWPWHVALFRGADYRCGGTLIDQRLVLTAAHCVARSGYRKILAPANTLTIRLGKIDLDLEESDHVQIINVSEIHVHEEFEANKNDIALLVLSREVQYSDYVIPICIDSIKTAKVDELVGEIGWVAGWAVTEDGKMAKQLKTTEVKVVSNAECVQSDKGYSYFVSEKVFCVEKFAACRGSGGGGMYILDGDQWELRGIPSFTLLNTETMSCDRNKFVIFTNVVSYYHWINEKTKGVVYDKALLPKGISGRKCRKYRKLARKNHKGVCANMRSPQTVAIIDRNERFISSGVIISERLILTKAPSLADIFKLAVDWDELRVRIRNEKDKQVKGPIFHPTFNPETNQNDIMILELKSPLVFTEALLPACLANQATENLIDILHFNGYTGINESGNVFYENNLNKIVTKQQCNKIIQSKQENWVFKEEICTTFNSNATFDWQGIIGGPLQTFNTRSCMYTLVGITKILIPPNETQYTNVFLRVTAYLDWLEQVIWEKD